MWAVPCTVTGLDIWASLLSTGAICTFYTAVVSDPPTPTPRRGAPRPPGGVHPEAIIHSLLSLSAKEACIPADRQFPHLNNEK